MSLYFEEKYFLTLTSLPALPEANFVCWLQSKNMVSLIKSIRQLALFSYEKVLYRAVLLIVVELQSVAFCQLLSYNSWAKINQFSDLDHCSDTCQEQRNEKERKSFRTHL